MSKNSFILSSQKVNIRIPFGCFPFLISFFYWNEVNIKSSIKEDTRYCTIENMAEEIYSEKLLETG